jgi:fibronectin-binding autotransporter adhesin
MLSRSARLKALALAISATFFANSPLLAASVTYDADTATSAPQDGAGLGWNTSNVNWWDGAANVAWPNTNIDEAIFGAGSGAAGSVTVGTVTVNKLTFNTPGSVSYTLATGTITLDGITPTISTGTGVTPTISAILAGNAGLTKTGAGTLPLSGVNTLTGQYIIAAGTLKTGSAAALGGSGAGNETLVQSGATLDVNGIALTATEIVRIAGSGVGGSGALVNTGAIQTNALNRVELTADASLGGVNRFDVRVGTTPTLDLAGFKLTKVGANQFSVVAGTITSGDIEINAGIFGIETSTTMTGSGTVTIGSAGTLGVYQNTGSVTRDIVSNGGTISNLGASGSIASNIAISGTTTLNDVSAVTTTLNGVISGAGAITKTGVGTFTLNGNNSYLGATTINAGRLNLTGTNVSAITVNSGGAIVSSGTGSTTGSLTLNTGSGIALAGGATLTGFTANTVNVAGTINVSFDTTPVAGNNYTVLNYGPNLSGVANYMLQTGHGVFTNTGSAVKLAYQGTTTSTWNMASGTWDLTTPNWTNSIGDNKYGNSDAVVFNNPSAVSTVAISGTVTPASVTINNSTNAYTFNGGTIGGTANLYKTGIGAATLSVANTYTGGTTISQGTLNIGNIASLGTGTLTLGDTNTGANNISLLWSPSGNTQTVANNIVVSSLGTGTVTIGTPVTTFINETFSGTMSLSRPTILTSGANSGDRTNFTGVISGHVGTLTLSSTNSARIILGGVNTFIGDVVLGGNVRLQLGVASAATNTIPDSSSVTVGAGTQLNLSYTGSGTETINALNGPGSVGTNAAVTSTLLVGFANGNGNFTGPISGGVNLAITKLGTGTQIFAGANTYTGATTVTGGTLRVSGSMTSATTVGTGATFNLTGTSTGAITVNSGGFLVGTGSTTGNITLNAGSSIIASPVGSNAIQGVNVTAAGAVTTYVTGAPTGVPATVDVVRYTGTTPTTTNFSAVNYRAGSFVDDTVNKKITLTYTGKDLSWTPTAGGTWDLATTSAWNASADQFFWGDAVTFPATAANQTVTLTGNLAPASISVTNAANTYTFSGAGSLVGGGTLSKSGAGTLTLSTANTFSGGTTITGGTISTGLATSLGTGVVTLNGGRLALTAGAQNFTQTFAIGSSGATIDTSGIAGSAITTTFSSPITGTGPLTLKATGNLAATGGGDGGLGIRLANISNSFVGDVTITGGLVNYVSDNSFGAVGNKIILNGGGLLDNNVNIILRRDIQVLAGGGTFRTYGTVNTTWTGAITGSGNINRTDGGILTLAGDLSGYSGTYANQAGTTVLTGTAATIGGNWTITANSLTVNSIANQSMSGNFTGAGTLIKAGSGTLTLVGTKTNTGPITVNGGTLSVPTGTTIYANAFNGATSGATLSVNGGGTLELVNWGYDDTVAHTMSLGGLRTNNFTLSINNGTIKITGTAPTTSNRGITMAGPTTLEAGAGANWTLSDPTGVNTTLVNTTNSLLTLTGAGTGEFEKILPGTNGLTKSGSGTWTLSAANTYSGTTTINGGTLRLGSGGTAGSIASTAAIVNNGILATNRSDALTIGAVISGNGGLQQIGTGTTTLSAANTYTGTTTVNAGSLLVTGSLANNGTASILMAANDDTLAGNALLTRPIAAGLNTYAGYGSTVTAASLDPVLAAPLQTKAEILMSGTNAAANNLTMQWRTRATSEVSPLIANSVLSDVLSLTDMGSDIFVLQMSYTDAALTNMGLIENSIALSGELRLGWKDLSNNWVSAVNNNDYSGGGAATFAGVTPWLTYYNTLSSFDDGSDLASFLGTYGVDPTNNVVWAVLNHNSEFAVIPEPSTWVLGGLALLGFARVGLRRRRTG